MSLSEGGDEDRSVFLTVDGKEYCVHEEAISRLLHHEVLMANSRKYLCLDGKTPREETLVLFVICNDIFAWGCADAESINLDEVADLYRLWEADNTWGPVQWVCRKRKEQPQFPVARDMKAAGAWDVVMDRLAPNHYDNAR